MIDSWIKVGARIRFVSTPDDPIFIEPGSIGTITSVTGPGLISGPPLGYYHIGVSWDDGNKSPISLPTDTVEEVIELTDEDLLKAAEARITRLETALQHGDLPSSDSHCECCNQLYVPGWDDVRCFRCTFSCCKPKGSREWVQGDQCPSKKCYD